jgi:hypothetical protein
MSTDNMDVDVDVGSSSERLNTDEAEPRASKAEKGKDASASVSASGKKRFEVKKVPSLILLFEPLLVFVLSPHILINPHTPSSYPHEPTYTLLISS